MCYRILEIVIKYISNGKRLENREYVLGEKSDSIRLVEQDYVSAG